MELFGARFRKEGTGTCVQSMKNVMQPFDEPLLLSNNIRLEIFFFSFFVPVALSFDYLRLVPETPSTFSNFFPRLSLVEDRFTAEPS